MADNTNTSLMGNSNSIPFPEFGESDATAAKKAAEAARLEQNLEVSDASAESVPKIPWYRSKVSARSSESSMMLVRIDRAPMSLSLVSTPLTGP